MLLHFFKKKSNPTTEPETETVASIAEEVIPIEINKDVNLGEFAVSFPHLAEVLAEDYGLHCVGCFASSFDTLEMGAQVHGMTETEIEEMIERLKQKHKEFMEQQKGQII